MLAFLISCMTVGVHGQTRTSYTTSAPPPPPPPQAQTGLRELCFLCCTTMADPSGRPQSSGVARRRRERRLRSMLRHERMTVAMALADFSHHSSRGQRMARARVWGHEQNYTAKVRKPPTPQPELFSLEEETGGGLPAPLSEVAGRQDKVVTSRSWCRGLFPWSCLSGRPWRLRCAVLFLVVERVPSAVVTETS